MGPKSLLTLPSPSPPSVASTAPAGLADGRQWVTLTPPCVSRHLEPQLTRAAGIQQPSAPQDPLSWWCLSPLSPHRQGPVASTLLPHCRAASDSLLKLQPLPHSLPLCPASLCCLGAALGWMLEARVPTERKLSFYLATSLALLLGAIGLYWSMVALGVDIDWSIHLATKWCLNPEWIRVDTRPFASLCRDTASALGLGLATHSSLYTQLRHERPGWKQRAVGAGLALAALQGLNNTAQPENVGLWYGLNFLKYASFPWVVVALVPWLVRSLPLTQTRPHSE
ncbi:glucose-6-phosphatase 3 isoform X4 [Chelonia mydas]|uniref:glucose-6-phosphatase 3 isoform X4 n=1 Tax=Chelonia mydas TaxID=8469 RepID=UPI001CA90DAB|nr:glucose-6-phosphatase 3 isoform X4 [Chelonia mydas]